MVKSGRRKYEYIENMKWRRPIYCVGVVSNDEGLQLVKKTGVNFFSKLRTFKGTIRCTLTIKTRKMREKNMDIWLGFIERRTNMRR